MTSASSVSEEQSLIWSHWDSPWNSGYLGMVAAYSRCCCCCNILEWGRVSGERRRASCLVALNLNMVSIRQHCDQVSGLDVLDEVRHKEGGRDRQGPVVCHMHVQAPGNPLQQVKIDLLQLLPWTYYSFSSAGSRCAPDKLITTWTLPLVLCTGIGSIACFSLLVCTSSSLCAPSRLPARSISSSTPTTRPATNSPG